MTAADSPARQLDRDVEPADHLGDQVVVRAPPERGVEVDQVDPTRPTGLPGQRGVERRAIPRFRLGLALDQSHRQTGFLSRVNWVSSSTVPDTGSRRS